MALPPEVQIPYPNIVEAATDSAGTLVMEDLVQFVEDEWVATYHDMSPHSPTVLKFQDQGFTFLYDQTSANGSDVEDKRT